MPQAKLNVAVLEVTSNALDLIYAACRQCYSAEFAGSIIRESSGDGKKSQFIRRIVASGHESPLEHAKFTFAVEGVSRALTHQLVRHRMASYSQQSQRYVKEDSFDFVVPPAIEKDRVLKQEFVSVMRAVQQSYNVLRDAIKASGVSGERANEDARFVLPQAAETKIVVTMNCRELLHFFQLRCCSRAQWEIKALAERMLELCRRELPEVFSGAGAKCRRLGYCPEGEKFTCGRYPLRKTKDPRLL